MQRTIHLLLTVGLMSAGFRAAAAHEHEGMQKHMKEALGLSDEQSKKLESAHKAHEAAAKPLHEALEKAMRKLHGELEIEAPEADVQAALEKAQSAEKALRAEEEKM